jgi:hypothetical protein
VNKATASLWSTSSQLARNDIHIDPISTVTRMKTPIVGFNSEKYRSEVKFLSDNITATPKRRHSTRHRTLWFTPIAGSSVLLLRLEADQ